MREVLKKTGWFALFWYFVTAVITYVVPNPHKEPVVYLIVFCGVTMVSLMAFVVFWVPYDIDREIKERKDKKHRS